MVPPGRGVWTLWLVFLACACAPSKPPAEPLRSPTLDYPLPAAQTSDGEIVGADRIPPSDKIREGPALGPGGATPAGRPGVGGPERGVVASPDLWPCRREAVRGAGPRAQRKNPCARR